MLTDHSPAQIYNATTLAIIPGPSATQNTLPAAAGSSAVGPANATLAGISTLPPQASATPGGKANGATGSGGNGAEVVQVFSTTTLVVSIVFSVPAATTSTVAPIVSISACMGIVPPGTFATSIEPASSTIQSGGNGGGGGNGSSLVTGSGITTPSGSATGSSSATGSGSATRSSLVTGSGTATESVSSHTSVPVVPTGGAEGATRWESWWLELGILVWGFGMVFWL